MSRRSSALDHHPRLGWLALLAILVLLQACGGGGGGGSGSSTTPTPTQPPTPTSKELVELSVLSTADTPGRAVGLLKDGDFVYVADNTRNVQLMEIAPGNELFRSGAIVLPEEVSSYSLAKSGNYLYVAGREGGLSVVEVSDPRNPRVVGTYPTPDIAMYITIQNDELILSDRRSLVAFNISDPEALSVSWSINADRLSFLRSMFVGDELVLAGYSDGVVTLTFAGGTPDQSLSQPIGRPAWSITTYTDPGSGKEYYLVGGERAGLNIFDPIEGKRQGDALPLTDLPNPTKDDETGFQIATMDRYALVADGANGVVAVNLDNLGAPYIAGKLPAGNDVRDIAMIGDNLMLVADSQVGVHLVSIAVYPDRDGDGIPNQEDAFPDDANEWADNDNDGVGDNADDDIDNDGIPDAEDTDRDGDGFSNNQDQFPSDGRYWIDSDGDGRGDNNPLLLIDNESASCDIQGDWSYQQGSRAHVGNSYLEKIADGSGASITCSPIVTQEGFYNVYATALAPSNPNVQQVASYVVETNNEVTDVYFDVDKRRRDWNLLGEFYFERGNSASVKLTDDGDGIYQVFGDAIMLIPSVTVPYDFISNFRYTYLGSYTHPDLKQWNAKRLLIDPEDPTVIYVAFNQTADLCAIDVTDPGNTKELSCYIAEPIDAAGYEVIRRDNYLILADRYAGIVVLELTGRGQFDVVRVLPTFDKASRVYANGDILYVGDTLGGMLTYDISDPSNPIYLNRVEIGSETRDIRVVGNYAYAGNYYNGLAIIDVTDPANPTLASRLKDPWNVTLGGVWDLEVKGNHLYMALQSIGLQIADISNPVAPVVISEIQIPNGRDFEFDGEVHADQPPLDMNLVNNLLLISNGAHGVLFFDVTDVNNVIFLDRIDTPSVAGEAKLHGSTLYIADGKGSGIQIYDISEFAYLYDPED